VSYTEPLEQGTARGYPIPEGGWVGQGRTKTLELLTSAKPPPTQKSSPLRSVSPEVLSSVPPGGDYVTLAFPPGAWRQLSICALQPILFFVFFCLRQGLDIAQSG
jgi:hypothetical protein